MLRASRETVGPLQHIVIAVEDTGIGIPPEAITNLFTDFNHASSVTSKIL